MLIAAGQAVNTCGESVRPGRTKVRRRCRTSPFGIEMGPSPVKARIPYPRDMGKIASEEQACGAVGYFVEHVLARQIWGGFIGG